MINFVDGTGKTVFETVKTSHSRRFGSRASRAAGGKTGLPVKYVDAIARMHRPEVKFFDQHCQVIRVHPGRIGWCGASFVAIRKVVTPAVGDCAVVIGR